MRLLALGLDHHRADIGLRERLAISASELAEVLGALRGQLAESVVLSTCNRTELYALVGHERSGRWTTVRCLADVRGVPVEQFADALSEHWQEDAVRHLFRVAAGLESMIVGEPEILGQVRSAGESARQAGSSGPLLTRLFRDAVAVGKRARTESGIARNPVSVSTAAVELARRALGGLAGRSVLVIGAGRMGALAARGLAEKGLATLMVASRRASRAEALAERVGASALPLERLVDGLTAADAVISSTAAPGFVVTESLVREAVARREARPLVLVDIAVPRDVEPSVADIPSCLLRNVDDLVAVQQASLAARRLEAPRVEALIEQEVEKYMDWWLGREVAPTIAELVARAEQIRVAELERGLARLGPMSERERNAVNAMTSAIVNKLLHQPIVRLKQRGRHHDSSLYSHAVRELFGLGERSAIGGQPSATDGRSGPGADG
jgi:glutamyl-tRNA reductase